MAGVEAKKRQKVRKGDQPGATKANLPGLETGKTRDKVGKRFGVSGKSISDRESLRGMIPMYDTLKYRRLRSKNCLNHCRVLLDLSFREDEKCPYLLTMGDLDLGGPHPYRHCWLEASTEDGKEVVVDLVHPERFFMRGLFYSRFRVMGETVHKYTPKEMSVKMLQCGEWRFWDMPEQETGATEAWGNWHRQTFPQDGP